MKIGSNRNFGIVFCIVFLLIAFYPILKNGDIRVWSLVVAIIFIFLAIIDSKILSPLNYLWIKFGFLLGKFISPIVLAIIFFLVVTPISLLLKIFGKDVLLLKKNESKSYWIQKNDQKSQMKNQF